MSTSPATVLQPTHDSVAEPTAVRLVGDTPLISAVGIAVSSDGLASFLTGLCEVVASTGGWTLADLDNVVQWDVSETAEVENVSITDGSFSAGSASMTATPTSTTGQFTIGASLPGTATYAHWLENWYSITPGLPPGPETNSDYGPFSFDVTELTFTATATLTVVNNGDDWNPQNQISASIDDVVQTALTVQTPTIPRESHVTGSSFLDYFGGTGGDFVLQTKLQASDLATAFVTALNVALTTIPDSGKLSATAFFTFQPTTQLQFPAGGGLQFGINGLITSTSGDPETAPSPAPVSLPDVPASGMAVSFGAYMFNAGVWAYAQDNDMGAKYPLPQDPQNEYNTLAYKDLLPDLYNFAPSSPITITLTNSTTASNSQLPTFSIVPAYCCSSVVLAGIGAPSDIVSALAPIVDDVYTSAADLEGALSSCLTSDEYSAWSSVIVNAAESFGLSCETIYDVAVGVEQHGVVATALSFTMTTSHMAESFSLGVVGTSQQILRYTLTFLDHELTLVSKASGLNFTDADVQTLWNQLLQTIVTDVTAELQGIGRQGLPIPHLPGFLMTGANMTVGSDSILVVGENVSAVN